MHPQANLRSRLREARQELMLGSYATSRHERLGERIVPPVVLPERLRPPAPLPRAPTRAQRRTTFRTITQGGAEAPNCHVDNTLWSDMENPTGQEEDDVEAVLGVNVPTPSERSAYEESARFYEDNGALYLTATLL